MGTFGKKLTPPQYGEENLRVQLATWIMMIVVGVTVCAAVGFYLQSSHGRSFLGAQTLMVEQCKRDPHSSPEECEEILAARSKRPVRTINKKIAGGIPSANFRLSGSED